MHSDFPAEPLFERKPTIPETLDFHHDNSAEHPMYVYREDADKELSSISYLEFARAGHRIAHALRPNRQGKDGTIVAVILLVDTILYQATVTGLMRTGFVPFPISPRLSPPAVAHLLKKTSCHRLIATQDTLRGLISGVKAELAKDDAQFELSVEEVPNIRQVFPKLGAEVADDPFERYPTLPVSIELPVMYLHSSGSTGFPKPVPLTHQAFLDWVSYGMSDLSMLRPRLIMAAMFSPPFHTLGVYTQLLHPIYCRVCIAVYPPVVFSTTDLPMIPSPDNVLDHMRRTNSTSMVTIPLMLQAWSHSQEAIDFLKTFVFVAYSGGPLAQKLGNRLADLGVNLKAIYGGTEFGAPTYVEVTPGREHLWEYMEFGPKDNIRFVDQGNDKYELQFLTSDAYHPGVENLEDLRGYATSDLFEKHPTEPNHWRIVGRVDDVIMHSSGEKTVPGPMEGVIGSSPMVKDVVMFGREHDQAGALIDMAPGHNIDSSDPEQLATLRNKLWPVIEEANKDAPAFSRIFKEMILFTFTDKPLPRSAKGTVMRKAALLLYNEEIEALYQIVESTAGGENVVPPESWDEATVKLWLLDQAKDIHNDQPVSPSKDLFEQGFDSLSATFMRLRIIGALRASKDFAKAAESVTQTIVYSHPTIDALTGFIVAVVENPEGTHLSQGGVDAIEAMITKYSAGLELPIDEHHTKVGETPTVVLLTGSTGNIGAQILSDLLGDKTVDRVYALNRPSGSQTSAERHRARFEDKDLDVSPLDTTKLVLVEGDTSEEHLGLDKATYEEIRDSVTVIVHGAWRLDFNLTLASFESNVRGTRKLIDLARSSPNASNVRFLFMSSISSAQSWDKSKGPYPEETLTDSRSSVGSGYGEGKYVTERILAQSGIHATSLRIGQVTGGSNGAWATSDWVPILVKSSLALDALPNAPGVVSWMPMDAVAKAILDVGLGKGPVPKALNFVHPRPITWTSMISSIREALIAQNNLDTTTLPLIPFSDWVEKIGEQAKRAKDEDLKKIPAVKLLEFFRVISSSGGSVADDSESGGLAAFDTTKAREVSATMGSLSQIGAGDARQWVGYWSRVGLFN
ncbi:putative nonribosomal peptide synthetase [Collybia nuda]|uniref:Nonribosomal peptide synthetase n=1 Tax=Collybia nuda TaxID=64659 RepID=A0A9P6CKL7_9AGAR|nr:putative nonribosomal peptide synthetase [Collybia nuda]